MIRRTCVVTFNGLHSFFGTGNQIATFSMPVRRATGSFARGTDGTGCGCALPVLPSLRPSLVGIDGDHDRRGLGSATAKRCRPVSGRREAIAH